MWTGAGTDGVLERGAVVIDAGVVREVGSASDVLERYPDANVIGSEEHVVLPGLVNSHHHGYGLTSLDLGIPDDSLESWLVDVRAATSPIDPYWDTLRSITRLIRSGVTTVLHVGSPRQPWEVESAARRSLQAHREAGMRVAYAVGVMDQNRFVYGDDEAFLDALPRALADRVRRMFDEISLPSVDDTLSLGTSLAAEHSDNALVRILLCPLAPHWCSDALLAQVADAASARLGVHTHCLESPRQRAYADRAYPDGTVRRLQEHGLVGPHVSLAHGVWLDASDIEICAETGTSVCHNASSNLRLRAGILPAASLVEAGVNVAMGTDSMSLNDDDDMFQEMRLVEQIHGVPGTRSTGRLGARDVLEMATGNGARPTTFADVGSLREGSAADAVVLRAGSTLERLVDAGVPVEGAIVRSARRDAVDTVMIGGDVVLSEGRFVTIDEGEVVDRLLESARTPRDDRAARWSGTMRELKPHVEAFYRSVDQAGPDA